MATEVKEVEPHLMAVLSSRINSIARQMTYTLQKSARSSVMSAARDLSTAICDAGGDVIALPNGFPVHVANMSLTAKWVMALQGSDLRRGDAILNNSPYHGNTHMADHTIVVPVFFEDELMFHCCCRGHQADIGNSIPTTYHATARDIYEEGALCFPCVRVQRDYRDIDDIIRMAKSRIRVPEVWYGDYLAALGAARIGEQALQEVVRKYGRELVKAFCRQWQEYGKTRMIEEIRKWPPGTCYGESKHDPIPGLLPGGVRVRVKVTVQPDAGRVIVDFTENEDSVPCGLNLCEATVTSAGRTGVMNRMPGDIPLCEGAMSRIEVLMRAGSVVGKAKLPYSSSLATTNVADRAVLAVQVALNQLTDRMGMAEGALSQPPSVSVISGYDSRRDRHYVTQLIMGHTGGMGVNGHDGYVHYAISNGGMMERNSIEIIEQKYPILFLNEEIMRDSSGAGKFDGGPATRVEMTCRQDPVTFIYVCDGKENPPRGAAGGQPGQAARALQFHRDDPGGTLLELPMFHRIDLHPGEVLVSEISSGGGYGDPLDRDPEGVLHRAREGWISGEKARGVYGVVLIPGPDVYAVDIAATAELRRKLQSERAAAR